METPIPSLNQFFSFFDDRFELSLSPSIGETPPRLHEAEARCALKECNKSVDLAINISRRPFQFHTERVEVAVECVERIPRKRNARCIDRNILILFLRSLGRKRKIARAQRARAESEL